MKNNSSRSLLQMAGFSILISASLMNLACEQSTPKLVGVPPVQERKTDGAGLQTFNPSVDVIFVIDDSGSMSSHQTNLRNNVDLFTTGLTANKFVDYHIGVITTSDTYSTWTGSGGGRLVGLPNFVDRNTMNGSAILKENIMVGMSGSATEMTFDPLVKALSEPLLSTLNIGFYRPSAFLAVVFITDAEDQSEKYNAQKMADFLVNLKKGDSSKILTYGVIVPSNDTTRCVRDAGEKPARIETFFALTGGKFYGLCDVDYGTKLAQIGSDLVERIGRRVLLDRLPQLDTVEVWYGTQRVEPHPETGWSYDVNENAIVLGRGITWSEQPEGTIVEVKFKPVGAI